MAPSQKSVHACATCCAHLSAPQRGQTMGGIRRFFPSSGVGMCLVRLIVQPLLMLRAPVPEGFPDALGSDGGVRRESGLALLQVLKAIFEPRIDVGGVHA